AKEFLDLLRFLKRRAQSDCYVVGEMVTADRNRSAMRYRSLIEDNDFGGARANVQQAGTQFALVQLENGIGAGERLEDDIIHVNTCAIRGGDEVLCRTGRTGHNMSIHFQAVRNHANRVLYAALIVDNEFLRQQVEGLPVSRQRYGAGSFNGLPDLFTT